MEIEESELFGVFPAVVTPLTSSDRLMKENLRLHIQTLKKEGCQGFALLGTTGEGPSMGINERVEVIKVGIAEAKGSTILVGTGSPSLTDTIYLTQKAFELGAKGVLVIPPYYYKNVSSDGVFIYYRRLIDEAVPKNGKIILYHIPQLTQVPFTFELIERLLEYAPNQIAGIKDSSGSLEYLGELSKCYPNFGIFVGNDKLFLSGLELGAVGCITAPSNILSPLLIEIFNTFNSGKDAGLLQNQLSLIRKVLEQYPPFPSSIKFLLSMRYKTKGWHLRPPLIPLSENEKRSLVNELIKIGAMNWLPWLEESFT